MHFTIEARELTRAETGDRRPEAEPLLTVVVAKDADEAIHRYVRDRSAELTSFVQPGASHESIGTIRKEDAMFLVRVYSE